MKIRAYIMFLLCLFQVSIYAQKAAQVTLTIRLHPIQAMEVKDDDTQKLEVYNENVESNHTQKPSGSHSLSTFSTSKHTTHVDSVNSKAFIQLRTDSESPPLNSKSVNQIFSDERFDSETHTDDLHVVYSMEPL